MLVAPSGCTIECAFDATGTASSVGFAAGSDSDEPGCSTSCVFASASTTPATRAASFEVVHSVPGKPTAGCASEAPPSSLYGYYMNCFVMHDYPIANTQASLFL